MTKTKTTKTETSRQCAMCGAHDGLLHHDKAVGEVLVALTKHECLLTPHCWVHGALICQPCQEGARENELEKSGTPEGLLAKAQRLQTEFWEALRDLEGELGFDVDDNRDLEGLTIEDLQAEHEDEDDDDEDDDCTCDERSWHGPEHDSACPLAGKVRA